MWGPFQLERGRGGPTGVQWETRYHYRRTGSKCQLEEPEGQQDSWSQELWGPRRRHARRPEPSVCTRVGRGLGGVWHGWHLGGSGGLAYSSETKSNPELRQRRRKQSTRQRHTEQRNQEPCPGTHRQNGALDTGREAQQGYSGRAKWGPRGTGEGGLPSKGAGRWEWRDEERMVTSRLGKLWEAWGDLCERSFSGEGVGEQPIESTYTPDPDKGRQERKKNTGQWGPIV